MGRFGDALPGPGPNGRTIAAMPWDKAPRVLAGIAVVAVAFALAMCSGSGSSNDDGPTGSDATLQEALRAHASGDLEAAEELYREVLAESPDDKYAHYNLGVIAQERDEVDEAVAEYDAALETDPDFVPALFNLAIVRTAQGEDREATQLYKRLLEIEPDNAAAHLNLGFLLIDRGREDRGQHELDEAVRLDPSLAERIEAEPAAGATGTTGAEG